MPHPTAQNSIRFRLILIPSCILALGVAAVVGVALYGAKSRIASEIQSSMTLGDHLIQYALDDLADTRNSDIAAQSQALQRLREGLADLRHIEIDYAQAPDGAQSAAPKPSVRHETPPAWFQALLRSPTIRKVYPVTIGGEPHGEIIMSSEPADEIAEIWSSLLFLTTLLTAISVAIVTLILITARHMLAPLRQLVEGLDRLSEGRFDAVAEIRIAELRRIGEHFNKLAATLARTEADNHFLIDRLLSIQEAERKELARELHDEFGASLFGIRAAASCIVEAASSGGRETGPTHAIVERANQISTLADAIQKQNYRILERIRPAVLRQMGLPDALRQLVEAWRAQHRDLSVEVEIRGARRSFSEEASLTSYRIVQECLTNAARHSKARGVRVVMEVRGAEAAGEIRLAIEDDGVGLPLDFRYGFGFLGMSERVRKLDGRLKVGAGAKGGALIEAFIPLGPEDVRGAPEPKTNERETKETAIHD